MQETHKENKIYMLEIQDAFQKELTECLTNVTSNKGKTKGNWSKLRAEVNPAYKETIGEMKKTSPGLVSMTTTQKFLPSDR